MSSVMALFETEQARGASVGRRASMALHKIIDGAPQATPRNTSTNDVVDRAVLTWVFVPGESNEPHFHRVATHLIRGAQPPSEQELLAAIGASGPRAGLESISPLTPFGDPEYQQAMAVGALNHIVRSLRDVDEPRWPKQGPALSALRDKCSELETLTDSNVSTIAGKPHTGGLEIVDVVAALRLGIAELCADSYRLTEAISPAPARFHSQALITLAQELAPVQHRMSHHVTNEQCVPLLRAILNSPHASAGSKRTEEFELLAKLAGIEPEPGTSAPKMAPGRPKLPGPGHPYPTSAPSDPTGMRR